MIQKLQKIDWSDIPKLKGCRITDRYIAENVFRYHWCTHLPTGKRLYHWRNEQGLCVARKFKPSRSIPIALEVVEQFVDQYSWSEDEYIKIQMNIQQKIYWEVISQKITFGRVEEIYKKAEQDLALSLCRAMLASYLAYGPKDYANGWKFEWEGPDSWPI
jgi:hypothetical protein